ncbi:hypothetical protein BDB01DRAFT_839933 [Pilobolus umbonatus]|nr:hypothetical protein BDB01DRAFT_839933 [Pilobolus umbonatus]
MNPVIHRERIYRLCPNISVLNISDHGKFTSNPSTAPNYNIKGLTLEETRIHSLLFKDIQACYPMLQELKLISNHDIVSTGNVYQLPETGLKRLILEYRSPVNRHMMVVKEVDGKTIKSWHYNYQSGDIKVTEGVNVADVVRQLSSEGLLLFKSTSIDSVLFTMH